MWQAIQGTHALCPSVCCTAALITLAIVQAILEIFQLLVLLLCFPGCVWAMTPGSSHSCSFLSQQMFQLCSVMLCFAKSLIHSWGKQDIMQGSMRSFSARLSGAACPCGLICIHSSSPFVIAAAKEGEQSNPVTLFPALHPRQEATVPGTAFAGMSPAGRGPRVPGCHCRIPMFSPVPVMALWDSLLSSLSNC